MKAAVIAPLTGIRLLAASWVVLFHIYLANGDDFSTRHPVIDAVVGPVVSQGDLGVDLFFLLSGFVLAHNYLERLGSRPSLPGAVTFYWLRLARVWPLYMIAVLGGGLLLLVRMRLWGTEPNVPLSLRQFVAQVLMVQQWGAPNVPNTSWTGPAWSISAEWLAYLCFPVLALAVWRVQRHTGRAVALGLAAAVLLPTVVWTAVAHTQAAPYMWLARLASEFTCGMLLSAAWSSAMPGLRRASTWLAAAVVVVGGAWLYVAAALDRPSLGPVVVVLFPLLVAVLVHGDGRLHRWLGSRVMIAGGGMSFALYLVHVPLLKLFRDAREHHVIPLAPQHEVIGELVVVCVCLLLAHVLFTRVEEPARIQMRALVPRVSECAATVQDWTVGSVRRALRAAPQRVVPVPVPVGIGMEHGVRQLLR